jgi:bifunctional DNA-binding transcriptional regulator/antitoxin component of YhaV-PrlF toxin-antitoxin module
MKLQKQLSRKVKNKEYVKWVIVLPSKLVKKLKWKEGQEIEVEIKKKKLILK